MWWIAMASEPSGNATTTGFFATVSVLRVAALGIAMIDASGKIGTSRRLFGSVLRLGGVVGRLNRRKVARHVDDLGR